MSLNSNSNKINSFLLSIAAFFMGFCSICYELIIASSLSRIFGEGMFLYPTCIAIFILFMGLGGAFCYYNTQKKNIPPLNLLLLTETLLTLFGIISILGINLVLFESLYAVNLEAMALGLIMAAMIGFLSGQELPLLFEFLNELRLGQKNIRRIILADYMASLFASVFCALFFFARFGFLKTSLIIAFINFLLIILIILILKVNKLSYGRGIYWLLSGFLAVFLLLGASIDRIENYLLKQVFMGHRNVKLLAKEYTPYQQILLFTMRKDGQKINENKDNILKNKKDYYLFAVLNGSLQFFEPFEAVADPDHTFLFEPHIQFLPPFNDILILGGGDGLPARQAVKYPQIKEITMVDIDEKWVEFVLNDPFMQLKNQNSLKDPRVKIHYADAFKWVLNCQKKFDLIIVDFPAEPASLAKIRTTSVQFFRDLNKILNKGGVVIIHSNGLSHPLRLKLFAKTAQKANLFPLFGKSEGIDQWTPVEQILLFKDNNLRDLYFDQYNDQYLKSAEHLKTRMKFGTVKYRIVEPASEWISFYDPLVSRLSVKDQIDLILHDKYYEN